MLGFRRQNETLSLSCYILTLDSERRISQVLESVRNIADEILIIDSGSKDTTLDRAASYGARILHRKFDNFRDQRIFAESHCAHNWVLALDSDEVLSGTLQTSIRTIKLNTLSCDPDTPPDAFAMQRDWFFLGKPVRNFYPVRTPERVIRLFRRDKATHFGSRIIHEQLQVNNLNIKTLPGSILHYSCDSIHDLYGKVNLYTSLAALDMHKRGIKPNWIKTNIYPWVIWAQWQILYRGILDGREGLILGKYIRDTTYLKYLKLTELRQQCGHIGKPTSQ